MSKIPADKMKEYIKQMLASRKERKFLETVDLQIGLKDYDPNKDKRFTSTTKLPYLCRPNLVKKICMIADAAHIEQCKKYNIPYITSEQLSKKYDPKDKRNGGKDFKRWQSNYKVLFMSESLVREIGKLGGQFLSKWGKFPTPIKANDNLQDKVNEVLSTVKFQIKKVTCLGVAVGNVKMTEDQLRTNITLAVNFLVALLKKGWNNIKTLYIRSTMGKPIRIF